MFNISNNQIVTMNRGDTANMYIYINIGTEMAPVWYPLQQFDKVIFALMEPNQDFEDAILKRVYTKDDMIYDPEKGYTIPYVILHLASGDTENLLAGVYYYSIKLLRYAGEEEEEYVVDTMVPRKKFILID